ncbi:uncharacterized protein [Spinacia oleracea]|uniref:Reverse transcriptase zinc-binding domain-containing protein n=1 Tax=Spinacia oleracea TaxID=3562 RepID=A0A9R0I6Y5_SPIOL|nr:uncharacterized protein LOC110783637 [Spinacia oleracea]
MALPGSASWVLKKIWGCRDLLDRDPMCKQLFFATGGYSIKKMYLCLLGQFPKVQWRRVVCNNFASPKSLFILWLAVHGRLSTKDRLMQWGIATDGVCSLCGVDPESVQHLSSQAFDQELQFAMRMSKKCTAVSKLLLAGFTEAVYCLWIQRNQRVFAGHVQSAEQIVKEIVFKVACRCRDSDIALLLY